MTISATAAADTCCPCWSVPVATAAFSGCGTKMTDTQLSSESSEVSLWMLPSFEDESEFASPRE
jgi:hypothetical protein